MYVYVCKGTWYVNFKFELAQKWFSFKWGLYSLICANPFDLDEMTFIYLKRYYNVLLDMGRPWRLRWMVPMKNMAVCVIGECSFAILESCIHYYLAKNNNNL